MNLRPLRHPAVSAPFSQGTDMRRLASSLNPNIELARVGSLPQTAAQHGVAADAQQRIPINPWCRSGGEQCAPALTVSAAGRT